jgi:hypothetical protein
LFSHPYAYLIEDEYIKVVIADKFQISTNGAKAGSHMIKLKTDSEIYSHNISYNDNYDKIGLYGVKFLSIDPLNAQNDVETEDIFTGSELKEPEYLDWVYGLNMDHGINVKIDVFTENIKLIEISFLYDFVIITLIGTVTKVKMINPSLYVIFKLDFYFIYDEAKMIKAIKDASKDLIDELYLKNYCFKKIKRSLVIDLFKINPKLKKLYVSYDIPDYEFEYVKLKAASLLENWAVERYYDQGWISLHLI